MSDYSKEERDIFTTNSEGRIRNQKKDPRFDNNYFKWGLTIFLTFFCCILAVYVLFYNEKFSAVIARINHILAPVYVGLIIAYLYSPLLNILEAKVMQPVFKKMKFITESAQKSLARVMAIIVIIIFSVVMIYVIIQVAIKHVFPSIISIVSNLSIYLNNINAWADRILKNNPALNSYISNDLNRYSADITEWVNENFKTFSTTVIKSVSQGFLAFLGKLWNFIIGFVISIYVLWSKEDHVARCKKLIYAFFSRETANALVEGFRYTHRTFIGFFFGKIVDSILIGLICFMGCTIMQTPYTVLVSIIVGVTNIIPFFGPYFGAIPSAILIFAYDPLHPGYALVFLLFIVVLQQFDGNVLGPRILSTSTGLTGFWIIFSITLFGGFWGLFGMVIGVPVFAVIYSGVRQLSRNKLKKKGFPYKTKDYLEVGAIAEDGSIKPIPPIEKKNDNKSIFTVIKESKAAKKKKDKKD
ncbi:MAG: AI-2E family transporter [Lachnospiraceae bacterium]|nr:AI-2E family transporter [Lachnospiraceae bacterium]